MPTQNLKLSRGDMKRVRGREKLKQQHIYSLNCISSTSVVILLLGLSCRRRLAFVPSSVRCPWSASCFSRASHAPPPPPPHQACGFCPPGPYFYPHCLGIWEWSQTHPDLAYQNFPALLGCSTGSCSVGFLGCHHLDGGTPLMLDRLPSVL
jgi:hypothetical protein